MKKILIFFIFTILIGSIYIYPDIRFIVELGHDFKGITLTGTNDETFYLSRYNGVYKGDYRLANIGLYEHKDDLWLIPPLFQTAIGLIGKLLNIPVVYLDIALSFLLPVLIFWLVYLLVYYISGSEKLGISGACCMIFGYAVFTPNYSILKEVITFNYPEALWFLRPYSPQVTYISFILSFLMIFLFIDTVKKWKLIFIILAVSSLNYLHLPLWGFLIAGLGIWLVIALIRRDAVIRNNIIIVLGSLVFLSIPYWINHYRINLSPNYDFLNQMFGTEYSHRPVMPLSYIFISAMIIFWNRKENKKVFEFLLVFLLGGFLCLNQQVITGRIMLMIYFWNYTAKTFVIVALIVSLNKLKKSKLMPVFVFSMVFLPVSGFMQQNNYYHANKNIYKDMQPLSNAFNWLNNNTDKEDVILTDSIDLASIGFIRTFLTYTKNYHYLSVEAAYLISREEKEDRILSAMRFFGYSLKEAEGIFSYDDGIIFLGLSACYGVARDVDKYISVLKQRYARLLSEPPIDLLRRYKVDYVLLGRKDHLFDVIEKKYDCLTKVFDDGNYKILEFNKTNIF